jgi:hypothetical protein
VADDDIQQHRVLERFSVRPQVRGEVGRGAAQQLLGQCVRPAGPQVLVLPLLESQTHPEPAIGRGYPAREAARAQFQPHGRAIGPEVGERDQEVQDVEVLRRRQLGERPPLTDGRITPVGANNKIGQVFPRPVRTVGQHPGHPVPGPDQVPDRRPHVQFKRQVLAGLVGEHGEDCGLGDEAGDEAQRLGRDPGAPPSPLVEVNRVDVGPGELAEPVAQSHLVEGVNAAGLQPVATESALKVEVPLQQRDLHPTASEQVGESRSGGPRPHDDDTSDHHYATRFRVK